MVIDVLCDLLGVDALLFEVADAVEISEGEVVEGQVVLPIVGYSNK